MRFCNDLCSGRFPVALEITPPREVKPAVLLRRARFLGGLPRAINVIQRGDRQSSLDASLDLLRAGIEPVWHLVARGCSHETLARDLDRARRGGISQVLCILGDRPSDGPSLRVRDLIEICREGLPGAAIGATLNQYGSDRGKAIANLRGKLAAGATFVETQPVFDPAHLQPLVEDARADFPETRFIAMVMPLTSIEGLRRMERRLGFQVPSAYAESVEQGPEAAWHAFAALIAALRESPFVDGIAVMTPEMDPSRATAAGVLRAFEQAGMGPDGLVLR